MGPAVRLSGVTAGYGGAAPWAGRRTVLHDVTREVGPGSIIGLVGRNGAGKTTLLRLILGLGAPWSGTVEVGGTAPEAYRRRHGVAYLPETPALPAGWRVGELLRYGCHLSGVPWEPGRSGRADVLGLTDSFHRDVGRLSKGTARRVALAWALTGDPPLIVLDEPTGGLDPCGRDSLRTVVREAATRGGTVLFSSHELDEVVRCCSAAHVVAGGRVHDARSGPDLRVGPLASDLERAEDAPT